MLLSLAVLLLASSSAQVTVNTVTVDGLTAPLGIDSLVPRFGWVLSASAGLRNVTQVAYQVLVTSVSSANLRETSSNNEIFWDSGRALGAASTAVPYAGSRALIAGEVFWISVRVWVGNGADEVSLWSTPQRFSVGLPSAAAWTPGASFISLPTGASVGACPWLRTSFALSAADVAIINAGNASALLHVASVGYHEPFLNGVRLDAGAVLLPSVSDLGRRVLSRTYDAAPALIEGENVLGFWLAAGWAAFKGVNPVMSFNLTGTAPCVLAQLRIAPPAGTVPPSHAPQLILATNATSGGWRARESSTRHIGNWTNSNFGGDAVDWRGDVIGWATATVDASSWAEVEAFPLVNDRLITPESLEPTGVLSSTVSAASVAPCNDGEVGCFVVTMSDIFTGWLNVSIIPAPPGTVVSISYTTTIGSEVAAYNQIDTVTLAVPGQSFCNRFSYHEILYVIFRGLSVAPALETITGLRLMNARLRSGSFSSTDPLLNGIYDAMAKTYEGLTQGGMTVDCPHRERLGYGGDAHTSLEFALATYNSGPFFRKWARDWADVQDWDGSSLGSLPHTAPTIDGGGGPGWGGFIVTMPWHVFQVTGDERILAMTYAPASAFLASLMSHANTSGLIQPFGGSWGFLGDWLTPHGSEQSDSIEALLFNNCLYVYYARLLAQTAAVIGDGAGAAALNASATVVANAVHAAFFSPLTNTYLDARQTHQVMPLIAGIVPVALISAVTASLVAAVTATKGHIDTGLHGTYFLAKVLSDPKMRRDDLLHVMSTQTSSPGYGALLDAGFTTWPEDWTGAPTGSKMHGCLNGFGLWFPQGLLGVRVTSPGFSRFNVRPAIGVGGLMSAQGTVATPHGTVAVAWKWTAASVIALNVTVPCNTAATLWLPAVNADHVTESGKPASTSPGVTFLRMDGADTVWALGSGDFVFLT